MLGFWTQQSFDLRLRSYEGNCDLCFLKGYQKKLRIIEEAPHRADWWREREREREVGATFRRDQPSYESLLRLVQRQGRLLLPEPNEDPGLIDCLCGD